MTQLKFYMLTAALIVAACRDPRFEDDLVNIGDMATPTERGDAEGTPTHTPEAPADPAPRALIIGEGARAAPFACLLHLTGWEVDRLRTDGAMDGSIPLAPYAVIVLLDGSDYEEAMPTEGQLSIVNFVQAGGGFVANEWISWDVWAQALGELEPIVPVSYDDYEVAARQYHSRVKGHPLTEGLDSFSVPSHSASYATLRAGAAALYDDGEGHPMIAELYYGAGRSVWFAAANDFEGFDWVSVPELSTLFVRAVAYAGGEALPGAEFDATTSANVCQSAADR